MINWRSDAVFFGIMLALMLVVLTMEHRRNTQKINVPDVPINANPAVSGSFGPLRDANLPLRRAQDDVLPTAATLM